MAACSQSEPYQYTRLNTNADEIRLLTLLPGNFDEPLVGLISHATLSIPKENKDGRTTLEDIRKTLPRGWEAYKTLDRRYIFWEEATENTSWSHPDSSIDKSLHEGYVDDPDPDYEPRFEALSYTWGSLANPQILHIRTSALDHEASNTSSLQISRSLASALRHLRYLRRPRTLWVDAVCIDQSCIPERNAQVLRMRQIYRLANRVVIWLGPSADSSPSALSTLEYLGRQVEITIDGMHIRAPQARERFWFSSRRQPSLSYSPEAWRALLCLFQRPWFQRLWVVQEVQLGNYHSIVQCGRELTLWSWCRVGMRCLRKRLSYSGSPLGTILSTMDILSRDSSTHTPDGLLAMATHLCCADQRDKVYGLLSMVSGSFAKRIQVNYSSSVTDVYTNFFIQLLGHTNRLDALRFAGEVTKLPGLPSWVPDWSVSPLRLINIGILDTSGASAAKAQFIQPGTLKVLGRRLATVHTVGEELSADPEQAANTIQKLWLKSANRSPYLAGESVSDPCVATFTEQKHPELYRQVSFPMALEWRNISRQFILRPDGAGPDYPRALKWREVFEQFILRRHSARPISGRPSQYVRDYERTMSGSAFVTTAEGFIGICPLKTRPGMCKLFCVVSSH
jgi:Heterokaryon incompatibility protein (HET)